MWLASSMMHPHIEPYEILNTWEHQDITSMMSVSYTSFLSFEILKISNEQSCLDSLSILMVKLYKNELKILWVRSIIHPTKIDIRHYNVKNVGIL